METQDTSRIRRSNRIGVLHTVAGGTFWHPEEPELSLTGNTPSRDQPLGGDPGEDSQEMPLHQGAPSFFPSKLYYKG